MLLKQAQKTPSQTTPPQAVQQGQQGGIMVYLPPSLPPTSIHNNKGVPTPFTNNKDTTNYLPN